MKLSDLVHYRNILVANRNQEWRWPLQNYIDLQQRGMRQNVVTRERFETQLENAVGKVATSLNELENCITGIIDDVNRMISEIEPEYFARSYNWYQQESGYETMDYILNRQLIVPEEDFDPLKFRVKNLTDWRYSLLCIRPGREDHIRWLVPAHPLYIADTDHELLQPAIDKFNTKYQRHLRPYKIKEDHDSMFDFIPDQQLGLIYSYYFFNFRPFEVIKRYLTELYHKLKPGGSIIFTFNNCDYSGGVRLTENMFCCYTPGKMLERLVESLGYLHIETVNTENGLYWMHLQRPGSLTTLRAGQNLAKIIPKTVE
jgi:hypothetical protein